MKNFVSGLLLAATVGIAAPAAAGIATNSKPMSVDSEFGSIVVTGALTGLAQYQSNAQHAAPGDGSSTLDLSNAWVAIQKTDGLVQFYVQGGLYSFPTAGASYEKAQDITKDTFGDIPVAYLKLQLGDSFSIEAGKLTTLVGAELPWTFQNVNIERGLLWFQEPLISRGVQVNYSSGALSVSLSWNDGGYTNVWNTFSGLISYAIDDSSSIAFDTSLTPARNFYGASQIYDLMYNVTSGAWTFGPYVQYQHYDATKAAGFTVSPSASDWGIGVLGSYSFGNNWSLGGRVEYEDSSGSGSALIYGPKSSAWSFSATPTWQKGIYFIRGEASYTNVSDEMSGFGKFHAKDNQFRTLLETGIVF